MDGVQYWYDVSFWGVYPPLAWQGRADALQEEQARHGEVCGEPTGEGRVQICSVTTYFEPLVLLDIAL